MENCKIPGFSEFSPCFLRFCQELTAPRRLGHLPLRAAGHGRPGPLHRTRGVRLRGGALGVAHGSEVVPPRAEAQEETAVRRDILEEFRRIFGFRRGFLFGRFLGSEKEGRTSWGDQEISDVDVCWCLPLFTCLHCPQGCKSKRSKKI